MALGTLWGMLLDAHGPLGSRLYPPFPGAASPAGSVLGVLMAGVFVQALGLGLALALLVHARPLVAGLRRAAGGRQGVAIGAFASLVWILASWIPHGSLHLHVDPTNFWALAALEWGFHVSLVAAGALLARFAFVAATGAAQPEASQARATAVVPAAR